MLTRQEIFDKAWTGLKAQGFRRSVLEADVQCAYRGDDGLKCAIGHCIDDARYSPSLEGLRAYEGFVRAAADIADEDGTFANMLQACHDCTGVPAVMEAELREFAVKYGLTIPEQE